MTAHDDTIPPETIERKTTLGLQLMNLSAVTLPLAGVIVAALLLWGWGFSWVHLGIMLAFYLLTGLGITIGFHRLFTHRAFQTYKSIQILFAILGSMAVEGPLMRWVANHRLHHQHSDEHEDPHSPHAHGAGWIAMFKGMWHSHMGWIFQPDAIDLHRYVGDLQKDGVIRIISALFPLWVVLGLLAPALLGGLLTLSWAGALLGFIWGGLVRIFLVHHVTWSINSVCHLWGTRPFETTDQSRNNPLFGILGMGEGWHNNHHAFPNSARHGLRWWEFDLSYYIIQLMTVLGLAWKVRLPDTEMLTAKKR